MNNRPSRAPDHPPLLDRVSEDIGGKTVAVRFAGTREEAQAILDEIDAKASALSGRPEDSEAQ